MRARDRGLLLVYFALSRTVAPSYLLSPTPHFKFFYTYYNITANKQTNTSSLFFLPHRELQALPVPDREKKKTFIL